LPVGGNVLAIILFAMAKTQPWLQQNRSKWYGHLSRKDGNDWVKNA